MVNGESVNLQTYEAWICSILNFHCHSIKVTSHYISCHLFPGLTKILALLRLISKERLCMSNTIIHSQSWTFWHIPDSDTWNPPTTNKSVPAHRFRETHRGGGGKKYPYQWCLDAMVLCTLIKFSLHSPSSRFNSRSTISMGSDEWWEVLCVLFPDLVEQDDANPWQIKKDMGVLELRSDLSCSSHICVQFFLLPFCLGHWPCSLLCLSSYFLVLIFYCVSFSLDRKSVV